MRRVVCHQQEGIGIVLPDFGNIRETGQHCIAIHEVGIDPVRSRVAGHGLPRIRRIHFRQISALIVVALIVQHLLENKGHCLENTVAEKVSLIFLDQTSLEECIRKLPSRIETADIRVFVVNGQIGNNLIIGIGRIENRHLITVLIKQNRHYLEGFIMLGYQGLAIPFIELKGRIFISAQKSRNSDIGAHPKGHRIGIIGKSRELLL